MGLDSDFVVDEEYNLDGFTNGYKNNTDAGEAKIMFKAVSSNFTGTKEFAFTISKCEVQNDNCFIQFEDYQTSFEYTGFAITPSYTVSVYIDGNTNRLVKNTDYTEEFNNNTNAGAATLKITFAGNYSGERTKEFTIRKKAIDVSGIAFTENSTFEYNGTAQYPTIANFDDYADKCSLEYKFNRGFNEEEGTETPFVNHGSYYVLATVTLDSAYHNNYQLVHEYIVFEDNKYVANKQYDINKFSVDLDEHISLSETAFTYNGSAQAPSVTVNIENETVKAEVEELITVPTNSIDSGRYYVAIDYSNTDYSTCNIYLPELYNYINYEIGKVDITDGNFGEYFVAPTIYKFTGNVNKESSLYISPVQMQTEKSGVKEGEKLVISKTLLDGNDIKVVLDLVDSHGYEAKNFTFIQDGTLSFSLTNADPVSVGLIEKVYYANTDIHYAAELTDLLFDPEQDVTLSAGTVYIKWGTTPNELFQKADVSSATHTTTDYEDYDEMYTISGNNDNLNFQIKDADGKVICNYKYVIPKDITLSNKFTINSLQFLTSGGEAVEGVINEAVTSQLVNSVINISLTMNQLNQTGKIKLNLTHSLDYSSKKAYFILGTGSETKDEAFYDRALEVADNTAFDIELDLTDKTQDVIYLWEGTNKYATTVVLLININVIDPDLEKVYIVAENCGRSSSSKGYFIYELDQIVLTEGSGGELIPNINLGGSYKHSTEYDTIRVVGVYYVSNGELVAVNEFYSNNMSSNRQIAEFELGGTTYHVNYIG